MRYSVIVASFIALAAALPTIAPVEENALAVRADAIDTPVTVEARQGFNPYDGTFDWPADSFTGGGRDAQFTAKNLGNGNYQFSFFNLSPLTLYYRVSNAGKTIGEATVGGQKSAGITVPKTGGNFNVIIRQA
ncbi:hypothetical protein FB567DRAFT_246180 [Paraphoma chrysanthemicola]|uniref:Uncharacterized protein n=1 Tax=Paraphoma chrysanthemicola TaxID=798071 RepID=A0A8K0VSM0_9PLEO|nr:hypothetical protein FB567DRAFT_246180 [Paraphoma chrysanthemicola]